MLENLLVVDVEDGCAFLPKEPEKLINNVNGKF
jgi:hypothetical protein